MTAYLCEKARSSPLDFEKEEPNKFTQVAAKRRERNADCCREIFIGVFFDGTNNNAERDRHPERMCHSNVARLLDVFPLEPSDHPKGQLTNYIRIYAPGVGTKFDAIGDSGDGDDLVWGETDRRRGLGFAAKGEARIVWALLAVLNQLSFYFSNNVLRDFNQTKALANELTEENLPLWAKLVPAATVSFLLAKRQLINTRRNEVLAGLCRELEQRIKQAQKAKPKPKILGIRLSVFGFSRGSAEARAFSNWFVEMCRNANGSMSLGGLAVDFDFLGIFDTVASVGLANSTLIADGHMEWADAEHTLRVPGEVTRCVHLVSAHEVRRSFPLDSIRVKRQMSGKHVEVVYPGVHSDVGGGYKPKEQGRGTDANGHDLLSRISLAHMYREARLANVPLDVNGQGVTAEAKAAMSVSPETAKAFNSYLDCCKVKQGTLEEILDEQTRLYVAWRKARLATMAQLESVKRASSQDRTDLLEANRELAEEASRLVQPVNKANLKYYDSSAIVLVKLGKQMLSSLDKTGLDAEHYQEWSTLRNSWESSSALPAPVLGLFDNQVHDSRAWFKPLGEDDHIWEARQRKRMELLAARQEYQDAPTWKQVLIAAGAGSSGNQELLIPLSQSEKHELDAYRKTGAIPPQPSGREPFWMGGGYLRYRRVYYGTDVRIVASVNPKQGSSA